MENPEILQENINFNNEKFTFNSKESSLDTFITNILSCERNDDILKINIKKDKEEVNKIKKKRKPKKDFWNEPAGYEEELLALYNTKGREIKHQSFEKKYVATRENTLRKVCKKNRSGYQCPKRSGSTSSSTCNKGSIDVSPSILKQTGLTSIPTCNKLSVQIGDLTSKQAIPVEDRGSCSR